MHPSVQFLTCVPALHRSCGNCFLTDPALKQSGGILFLALSVSHSTIILWLPRIANGGLRCDVSKPTKSCHADVWPPLDAEDKAVILYAGPLYIRTPYEGKRIDQDLEIPHC